MTAPETDRASPLPALALAEYEVVHCAVAGSLGRAPYLLERITVEDRWPATVWVAQYHGVVPLLYAALREAPVPVPAGLVGELRGLVNARSAHGLFLFQELGRIHRLLEGEGVQVLAIKGPVLAQHVYGSIALRPFVDLDLVVAPVAFSRAAAVLRAADFQWEPLSPGRLRLYVRIHRQYTFWKHVPFGGGRALSVVDLHAGLMPPGYTDGASFEALWARSRPLRVMQEEVRMPGPEDLVRILVFHGFKNRWDRLKYVADLAETLRVELDLDWDSLLQQARRERWRRVLALGLQVCKRVAGVELPPDARAAAHDSRVEPIAEGVLARMPQQAYMRVEPYLDRVQLNLLAQDSLLGQARYAGYAAARRLSEFVLPAHKD